MKNKTQGKGPHKLLPLLLTVYLMLNGCASMYDPLPKRYPQPQPTPSPTQASLPAPSLPQPEDYKKETVPEKKEPTADFTARTGSAASLYHEARTAMKQGQYSRAELALERALRIEPSNGYYWYAMGELKYRQNDFPQAVNFCLKSKSMAGKDRQLLRLNDELIQMAR